MRLEWRHAHSEVRRAEGELVLRESPFDPVADLPVRRLVRMEYEEGTTESNGRVLRSVPGEWLLPFLHQRYDDPGAEGSRGLTRQRGLRDARVRRDAWRS